MIPWQVLSCDACMLDVAILTFVLDEKQMMKVAITDIWDMFQRAKDSVSD